jgi:hypothetical protein
MTDAELEKKFTEIDDAIERLFGLFGLMAPRQAAMRPRHLRDAGEDQCEVMGGLMIVKSPKAITP